jgi:hypothetical protein
MRIHGNQTQLNAVNPYAAAAERATAAQRSADGRKKPVKSANDFEGIASPDEAFLVGQWTGVRQSQTRVDVEYHTTVAGKDSDFG